MRASALEEAGGFDASLIAGEEPELCRRLAGAWLSHRAHRRSHDGHDLNMTRFRQYWLRAVRAGHAYAEISSRFRDTEIACGCRKQKNYRSAVFWLSWFRLRSLSVVKSPFGQFPGWRFASFGGPFGLEEPVEDCRSAGVVTALWSAFACPANSDLYRAVALSFQRRSALIEYKKS